jgi:CheY-like chemotaxis protein
MRVLVVEDEQDIREGIAEVLDSEGYEVAQASNGCEGLTRARQFHPDVILLDLMMPVMNGWQFLDEQQHDAGIAQIPVVIVSARPARDLPTAAQIQKPFDIALLLSTVIQVAPASARA